MEHRRFLAHPEAHRPFIGGNLLQRIGGRTAVETLIDGLDDSINSGAAENMRPTMSVASAVISVTEIQNQMSPRPRQGIIPAPARAD
jgi:hypothetical protein